MFISALSKNNCNFGTCIPITQAYYKDKYGNIEAVPDEKIPGLTTALVKRLKNVHSRESRFLSNAVDSFSSATEMDYNNEQLGHKVCSTSIGNKDKYIEQAGEKTHLIFGEDINLMRNWSRQYRIGTITNNTLVHRICSQILKPKANRGKACYRNDEVKLVLHADYSGGKYKLNGMQLVTDDREIIDTLLPEFEEELANQEAYDEYRKEREALEEDTRQRELLEQAEPDLLSDDDFYLEREAEIDAHILKETKPKNIKYIQGTLF